MSKEVKINLNNTGDIKKFINAARSFESCIDIVSDRVRLDAKSIMALFSLDLSQNLKTVIISDDITEIRRFHERMEEFK